MKREVEKFKGAVFAALFFGGVVWMQWSNNP